MKQLKFIHVTKTAGTSIENIAKEKNINWGRFDDEYKVLSPSPSCWWHHVIPKSTKYDWFIVIRNPIDRVISEFYCPYDKVDKRRFSIKQFNDYIVEKIQTWTSNQSGHYHPQFLHIENKDKDTKIHILHFNNL